MISISKVMNSSTFLLVEINVFVSLMEHYLEVLLFSLLASHTLSVWLLYLKASLLSAGGNPQSISVCQWKHTSSAYINFCFRFDSCDSLESVNKTNIKILIKFFSQYWKVYLKLSNIVLVFDDAYGFKDFWINVLLICYYFFHTCILPH